MWSRWLDSKTRSGRAAVLYLAIFLCFMVASAALYQLIDVPGALFCNDLFVGAALVFGYRRRGKGRWAIGYLIGFVALGAAVSLTPFGALDTSPIDAASAVHLPWLVLVLACGASSEDAVLFLLVPCMAMTFAAAIHSVEPVIVADALVLCSLSMFALLVHAHLKEVQRLERGAGTLRQLLLDQTTLAGLTFIVTALIALFLSAPLRVVGAAIRPMVRSAGLRLGATARKEPNSVTPSLWGGYSTADSVLVGQGPVDPAKTPVLTLRSPEQGLLLARVYDLYKGEQGWQEAFKGDLPSALVEADGNRFSLPQNPASAGWREVQHTIQLMVETDTAPAFAELQTLEKANRSVVLRIDPYGCARVQSGLSSLLAYTAYSRVPPDIESLRAVGTPLPPASAPPFISSRVTGLAAQLKGRDEIETTRNVVRYLQSHCTYDLSAPAVPVGRDPADFFLFDSRAGYCDLFATSCAVLLQQDGVPVRYCIGYAPGQWDSELGAYLITAAEAHAWVEVFVRGAGWIPVDATPPGFSGPPSAPVRLRGFLRRFRIRMPEIAGADYLFAAALLPILLLYLTTHPLFKRRRFAQNRLEDPEAAQALLDYWDLESLLARRGLPRHTEETAGEYLSRVELLLPPDQRELLRSVVHRFILVRYGGDRRAALPARQAVDRFLREELPRSLRGLAPKRFRFAGNCLRR